MMNAAIQKEHNLVWGEPVKVFNRKEKKEMKAADLLNNFPRRSIINHGEMGEISMDAPIENENVNASVNVNVISAQMSTEQAEIILKKFLKHVKRAIKQKIALYEPLEFKTAYKRFLNRVREDRYRVIREMPGNGAFQEYLDNYIKDFLIENAYYAMEEKHIRQRVMNKLGLSDPHNIRLLETVDFIMEGIEREGMKRIKSFGEKCKFKTYFFTVVSSLLNDYWRRHYTAEKHVTKYEPEFEQLFDKPQQSPLDFLIRMDDNETRARAEELLPGLVNQLTGEEQVVIKLKYEKNLSISAIARTIGRSRFKTEQYIKQLERRISMDILQKMNNHARGERPGGLK